jgi:hypothetical protein
VPDQNDVVKADIRQGLLLWLGKWGQRHDSAISSDTYFRDVSARTWAQLSLKIDVQRDAKSVRRHTKNLDRCALPTCVVKDNCKTCSK